MELFKELDETKKLSVWLGDNKEIMVEGQGTVTINTSPCEERLLSEVQFVPDLAHNLLSVG